MGFYSHLIPMKVLHSYLTFAKRALKKKEYDLANEPLLRGKFSKKNHKIVKFDQD